MTETVLRRWWPLPLAMFGTVAAVLVTAATPVPGPVWHAAFGLVAATAAVCLVWPTTSTRAAVTFVTAAVFGARGLAVVTGDLDTWRHAVVAAGAWWLLGTLVGVAAGLAEGLDVRNRAAADMRRHHFRPLTAPRIATEDRHRARTSGPA